MKTAEENLKPMESASASARVGLTFLRNLAFGLAECSCYWAKYHSSDGGVIKWGKGNILGETPLNPTLGTRVGVWLLSGVKAIFYRF